MVGFREMHYFEWAIKTDLRTKKEFLAERKKRRYVRQLAKHAWLYSDLRRAFTALVSQQMGPGFFRPRYSHCVSITNKRTVYTITLFTIAPFTINFV